MPSLPFLYLRRLVFLLLGILGLSGLLGRAEAHATSDHFLNLQVQGQQLTGYWDVMLPDLDDALKLDADADGRVSNQELTVSGLKARDYMLGHLTVTQEGQVCPMTDTNMQVGKKENGRFVRLSISGQCRAVPDVLKVKNTLFTDIGDQNQHRGYLNLEVGGRTQTSVFAPDSTVAEVALARGGSLQNFAKFVWLGMTHIWAGIDHVLFLLTLLLPAVLQRKDGRWVPVSSFKDAGLSVVRVVTAFTVAHSVTLSLSALGVVTLPSRLVESIIAISVVFTALNNIFPVIQERGRWMVAFGFGLIHGFGFSSVLGELVQDRSALVGSLLGFNIGVEFGQLALIAVVVPLIFLVRATTFYRRIVFAPASAAVAVVACVWFMQRAFL